MNVRRFRSAAQKEAAQNLADFVNRAKASNPFAGVEWSSERWPFPNRKRASASGRDHLNFTLHPDASGSRKPMIGSFGDFIRAAVVHRENARVGGFSYSAQNNLVRAGRALYEILAERDAEPVDLVPDDFQEALNRASLRHKLSGLPTFSQDLVRLAEILDAHGLTATPLQWNRRVAEPKRSNVGPEGEAVRRARLPSEHVLDALAFLGNVGDLSPRDLIRQRAIELLVCAGFRINEVLTLPRNALVEEPAIGENGAQLLDRFGKPIFRLGLRYWPEKGGHVETQLKVIPTVMHTIARRAIADVLSLTETFARDAKFMHDNPDRANLEFCNDLGEGDLIETEYLPSLLGSTKNKPNQWMTYFKCHGVPVAHVARTISVRAHTAVLKGRQINRRGRTFQRKVLAVRKRDLETHLRARSKLGNVLGDVGHQLLHESLFVVSARFFDPFMTAGVRGTATLMNDSHIHIYLSGHQRKGKKEGESPSVFEKRGLTGPDGRPLRATSHQFRRWLNTLAIEGGLNDHELARWMGRTQVSQNAAYDYSRPIERAKRVRTALLAGEAQGPIADAVADAAPARRDEFVQSVANTVHVTDLGLCTHDWTALPCPDFGGCETCFRLFIVKGDKNAMEQTEWQLRQVTIACEMAEAERADGTMGADNWERSHRARKKALEAILSVHRNDTITDGTLVQLTEHGWSILGDAELPDGA